jgi:hypothetical protein
MPKFAMPAEVTALPAEQQEAIRNVLIQKHLLTADGQVAKFGAGNLPEEHPIQALGFGPNFGFLGGGFGCIAARIAEGAAIAACATIPGGQIAIAACVAVAHAAADQACK